MIGSGSNNFLLLLLAASLAFASEASAADGCDTIDHYQDQKRQALAGLGGDEQSGLWRGRVDDTTPFVRVHTFQKDQLDDLISGKAIRSPIADFFIKNAAGTTDEWYGEFKKIRQHGSGALGIEKGWTGHQVLLNRFWEQVDGKWRRKADLGTTGGTGDVVFPVSAFGPADTGYVDRFKKDPNTGLIVFKEGVRQKLMWGNPSVSETELLLPVQIQPGDVEKIIFSDGSVKRPLSPAVQSPRAGRAMPRMGKVAGYGAAALLIYANASQFAHAYEANDWSGMGEVAWDQFVPVPLSSPWEWERAYRDNVSMARTSEQRVIGAFMTPYSMIGRSMSGIGSLVGTGAEAAFGWTAPRGSKAQGVWSPWRESQY